MQKWTTTCTDGFTKTVDAATKEDAVKMVMMDPEMMDHVKTTHPEWMSKTPEEMMASVMGMTNPAM